MKVNQIHNGSGDNIAGNKIIITPKEPPLIISSRIFSSIKYDGGYQYIFSITVGNPYSDFRINVNVLGSNKTGITKKPILQKSFTRTSDRGSIFCKEYLLAVFSDVQLHEKDFTFSVEV